MRLTRYFALGFAVVGIGLGSVPATAEEDASCRDLFPFGVRERGRPERAPAADEDRARAVRAGLVWLAAHQAANGGWEAANLNWCRGKRIDEDVQGKGKPLYDVGVTGMAVSAFLSAGHTTDETDPYGSAIERGLRYLKNVQDKEGCIGLRTCQHYIYNHAFAALALVEAFGVTGDPDLLEPARKGLAFSTLARNPGAAWRYGVKPGDNDTSVTGCVAMAFVAAHLLNRAAESAGRPAPLPFDPDLCVGVRAWLDRMTDEAGYVGYIQKGGACARPQDLIDQFPGEHAEPCTSIGILMRLVLPGGDAEKDAELVAKGAALVGRLRPRWDVKGGYTDDYYWYYGSLAMLHVGGEHWTAWRKALVSTLVGAQRKDTTPCEYAGSWDPVSPWGPDGGRTYSTALAVLTLQTEHRFPPLSEEREDLLVALDDARLETGEQVRLLRAIAAHEVPEASKAARPRVMHDAPGVRAAAAEVLGACTSDGRAVKDLTRLLADDAVEVRRAAAGSLERLGRKAQRAVPAIVKALDDSDERVRVLALRALREMGTAAAPGLERARALLADPWPRVRVAAASVVWHAGEDSAAAEPVLVAALKIRGATARADAARALGREGASSDTAQAALAGALDDEQLLVRIEAALALVGLGHDASALVEVAKTCLEEGSYPVRLRALELVAKLGPKAVDAAEKLVPVALDGPQAQRVDAARALGALGIGAEGAVAALIACRWRSSPAVQEAAATALASLEDDDEAWIASLLRSLFDENERLAYASVIGLAERGKPAVPPLLELLREKEGRDRRIVLYALSHLGEVAAAGVPQAIALLDVADEPKLQADAAKFLGTTGRHAAKAVGPLEALVASEDRDAQAEALRALGRIGEGGVKDAALALSRVVDQAKPDWRWRRGQALRILASLGPAAEPALPALLEAMGDKELAWVRDGAVAAVVAIGRPALKALKKGIGDHDQVYRKSVYAAIAGIGEDAKKLVPELTKAMYARWRGESYDIAGALAGIGKASVRPFIKMLKSDEPQIRIAAAWGLGRIGKTAKAAIRDLERLLDDPFDHVREQARKALNRIRG